jgi:outer membrane receptor protein involved in Fe transport
VTLSGWIKSEGAGQLWDISQVEILRGPQSTNIGRNALAGAVIVNTNDPVYYNEGSVRVGFGEYGKQELNGMANINIVEDVAAVRFSLENTQSDGFVNNIIRNEDDYGNSDNAIYRMKFLYQPIDDLKSVLSYQRIESVYGLETTMTGGEFNKADRISIAGDDSTFEIDADLLSLNIDYNINDEWSMKSITAYQSGERLRLSDTDLGPLTVGEGGGIVNQVMKDKNWSQELRFNYDNSSNLRGSSGVYFANIEADYVQNRNVDLTLSPLFDELAPGLGMALTTDAVFGFAIYEPYFDTNQNGFTDVETSTWAVFSEWEYDLDDKWMLSAGVRYDSETQKFATGSVTTTNSTVPGFLAPPLGDFDMGGFSLNQVIGLINMELAAFIAPTPAQSKSEDFSNVLPHVGITYNWNDDVSSSFFVKKSYRSGGSELTLLSGVNNFDAEELWNYEASLRAVVLDGKGVFNTNVYYSDWTDQQVAIQEPGTNSSAFVVTVNAGSSKLYGFEASFDYELTESLNLYSGLAISHTEYVEFNAGSATLTFRDGDLSGNSFSFAPEETAVLGLNYFQSGGFFANASVSYVGESYSDVFNTKKMDSYTLVNINAGYEFEHLKLEVYAKNATDELYDTNNNLSNVSNAEGITLGDGVILGAPREIGARVTFAF